MLTEFIQKYEVAAKVATLITDGVSSSSHLVAVVLSDYPSPEKVMDVPDFSGTAGESEGTLYVFPGADPSATVKYTDFTPEEYKTWLSGEDKDQVTARLVKDLADVDLVVTHTISFFERFQPCDMDALDLGAVAQFEQTKVFEKGYDTLEEAIGLTPLHNPAEELKVAVSSHMFVMPPVMFKDMKKACDLNLTDPIPVWKEIHVHLRALTALY